MRPMPAETASRTNATFSGVFLSRLVPSPIRVSGVSPSASAAMSVTLGDVVGDVVVRDARLAVDEIALVLGVENRGFDLLAGEGADRIERVPQRQGDELGGAPVVVAQEPGAAVPGRSTVVGKAGLPDVAGVLIGIGGADGAAPDSGDHSPKAGRP